MENPAGKVTSAHMTQTGMSRKYGTDVITTSNAELWFVAPNKWRLEIQSETADQMSTTIGAVSDGISSTTWRTQQGETRVTIHPLPTEAAFASLRNEGNTRYKECSDSFEEELNARSRRMTRTATVHGEDKIAGRPVYFVELSPMSLSLQNRADTQLVQMNGPLFEWFDKETWFTLKAENYGADGIVYYRSAVLTVEYNIAISPTLFTFTPPTNETITYRGKKE